MNTLKANTEDADRTDLLLSQALESGEPTPMTKKDWDDVRKELRRRAEQRARDLKRILDEEN